jgi:hypothetical protein
MFAEKAFRTTKPVSIFNNLNVVLEFTFAYYSLMLKNRSSEFTIMLDTIRSMKTVYKFNAAFRLMFMQCSFMFQQQKTIFSWPKIMWGIEYLLKTVPQRRTI